MSKIHRLNPGKLLGVIDSRAPLGLFLAKKDRKWVAVDNSTGDAWTEEFTSKRQAVRWLLDEIDTDGQSEQWDRISDAASLITAAMQQGVILDAEEASMILGYFEGHDYCLMVDSGGRTMRHDKQYGDSHIEDETYTVLDAIVFCQEMNADLLYEKPLDERYLSQLLKDEQVLDALIGRLVYTRRCCYASFSSGTRA